MMKAKRILPICLCAAVSLVLLMCTCRETPLEDNQLDWYRYETNAPADVFYLVSTNVGHSLDADGKESYTALLNDDEKAAFLKEFDYVHAAFSDSLNFFAPYYHQYTMATISLPEKQQEAIHESVLDEICKSFDWYMSELNHGRPFILAGFSQGSEHILGLLKHMSDEQYSRCIAAYSLGYRVSEEDLADPHINAAQSEKDLGVTISFNSVADVSAIWPLVTEGAAACINPVNWCTDATPASFEYNGETATVHVDTTEHVLIVEGIDPSSCYPAGLSEYCKLGNFHLGDLIFYSEYIGQNARRRAAVYQGD